MPWKQKFQREATETRRGECFQLKFGEETHFPGGPSFCAGSLLGVVLMVVREVSLGSWPKELGIWIGKHCFQCPSLDLPVCSAFICVEIFYTFKYTLWIEQDVLQWPTVTRKESFTNRPLLLLLIPFNFKPVRRIQEIKKL